MTKCDIFSLGIILYQIMLESEESESIKFIDRKINQGGHESNLNYSTSYSHPLKNLISEMISEIPEMRPSANEILIRMGSDEV